MAQLMGAVNGKEGTLATQITNFQESLNIKTPDNKENEANFYDEFNENGEPWKMGTNFFGYPEQAAVKTRSYNSMFRIENDIEEIDRKIRKLEEYRAKEKTRRAREKRDRLAAARQEAHEANNALASELLKR